MGKPFVAILMGSDSDLPMVEAGFAVLEKFAIRYEVKVTSAHRTPEATAEFVRDAEPVVVWCLSAPPEWPRISLVRWRR